MGIGALDGVPGAKSKPDTSADRADTSGNDRYRLSDRYRREEGRVFLTGVQALARLPLDQLRIDRRAGNRTAAFVAGYQGSPLAGFGDEVERATSSVNDLEVVLNRSVNEELAATAVMGSQLAATMPDCRHDGVLGIWFGKAPGLDRAGDAIRHGVFAGTHPLGGVVAVIGDDPLAKSSTLPSSSDATMVDLHMPILFPGDVQEALDLGRHAVALSRTCGLWAGVKLVTSVADGSGTIDVAPDRVVPQLPRLERDGEVFVPWPNGRLLTPYTLEMEREFVEVRSELARHYGVMNNLNRVTVQGGRDWIGIMASGSTYHEVRAALAQLGLPDDESLRRAGIRMLQLLMPVPLDQGQTQQFARGLEEILVIEEKNPTLERLVRDVLYDLEHRPRVCGRSDTDGRPLIPGIGGLDVDTLIGPLRTRLAQRCGDLLLPETTPRRGAAIALAQLPVEPRAERAPYFCSGCPHNVSTRVEPGTLVGGGIGCHAMVAMMPPDRVGEIIGLTAMGGEGAQWIGMAPFLGRQHLVQNIGDGTYFHSGSLAVRAAVASGIDITYKLLYNGTVAMTGGQDASGAMGVGDLARSLLLEGAAAVIVSTDDRTRYRHGELPSEVEVIDRSKLLEAQRRLAQIHGVTVLIHDQACAAENRRARSRQLLAKPAFKVVINERVCEGCGDCAAKSNCLSVQPVETLWGRKTRIDQTSCNFDLSCLQGDCPAFATVVPGGTVDSQTGLAGELDPGELSEPEAIVNIDAFNIRLIGIGGTGVVTVSQILGTAAMLDGAEVRGLDQTGLSQKAGPVVSDLCVSRRGVPATNHAASGTIDCLIAADLLAATSESQRRCAQSDRTVVIASTTAVPTGEMVVQPATPYPDLGGLRQMLDRVSRSDHNRYVDASALCTALFGSAQSANMMLIGVAVQAGAIPLSPVSIERAIELNDVAVPRNIAAFRWGRSWAMDPGRVEAIAGLGEPESESSAQLVERLRLDLVDYGSRRMAETFSRLVSKVERAEAQLLSETGIPDPPALGPDSLTAVVARNLHRLMAYKDEYEVARLVLLEESQRSYREIGGPRARVTFLLHPPALRTLGLNRKIRFRHSAPLMFRVLRAMRHLRGTWLDPFGWARLRRMERAMIPEYVAAIEQVVAHLSPERLGDAVSIAMLPDQVRGFEHLKMSRAADYRHELTNAVARFCQNGSAQLV